MTRVGEKQEKVSQDRIAFLIEKYCDGKQQIFADRCKIGKSSVSQYVNRTNAPGNITAKKIGDAFFINPMWVMGFDVPMRSDDTISSAETKSVPIYGKVCAGNGTCAFEDITGYVNVSKALASTGEIFALRIKGDSMEPKISDGDIVIVRKQEDADSGDIVIALINGDDGVCKKLKKYQGGIMLVSNNPKYDPFIFTEQDTDDIPVRILGRVMELRSQL